jgi:hypothetical protein
MAYTPKLKLVFVAGVEGVGHHGLNPVLKKSFEVSQQIQETSGSVILDKKRLKRVFNMLWCHENSPWIVQKWAQWYSRYFFSKEQGIALKNKQVRIFIEGNSFPAGRYRNPDRQWDLQEMINIVSPYAEIKFIALYRDPIASTYSRQNMDGGLHNHAPVVKESLKYVNSQLSLIDPKDLLVVHYEDMINRKEEFAKVVAGYLGIRQSDVEEGLKLVRQSTKNWRHDLSAEDQNRLLDVFPPGCEKDWPILAKSDINRM